MKGFYWSILVLMFFCSGVLADEVPSVMLQEGTNRVSLSVVNKWNNDLSKLTVRVDKNKLPEWLTFQGVTRPIDIRSGTKGKEKIYMTFNVIDAPSGMEAVIPFTLQDAYNNHWNYKLKVYVSANNPLGNELFENFPNPFNPTTTIRYSLSKSHNVSLVVYNTLGQKIRTLVDEPQSPGIHAVQWDGTNDNGERVSSGLYFYRLKAGSLLSTKRMMLLE